ncbi:9397_t:CDS:2, partial [Racocetra fulgida]
DEITNLIIDTFVEYAVKVGIGTTQAEIVANTMVTLSSVNVRGKIIARLRNVRIIYNNNSFESTRDMPDTMPLSSLETVIQALLEVIICGAPSVDPDLNLIHSSMLGYLAALLPLSAKNGDMKELLWLCGIFDMDIDNSELSTTYFAIFEKLDIPDNRTALLLVSLMVTMLQNAEHEPERLFLYGFLAEAANAVQSILLAVASVPQLARPPENHTSYLEEVKFNNLMECGSFQSVTREKMKNNARLASELVDCIISPD